MPLGDGLVPRGDGAVDAVDFTYTTISRPFERPQTGKICVKVINHFGDEVQKVFAV